MFLDSINDPKQLGKGASIPPGRTIHRTSRDTNIIYIIHIDIKYFQNRITDSPPWWIIIGYLNQHSHRTPLPPAHLDVPTTLHERVLCAVLQSEFISHLGRAYRSRQVLDVGGGGYKNRRWWLFISYTNSPYCVWHNATTPFCVVALHGTARHQKCRVLTCAGYTAALNHDYGKRPRNTDRLSTHYSRHTRKDTPILPYYHTSIHT